MTDPDDRLTVVDVIDSVPDAHAALLELVDSLGPEVKAIRMGVVLIERQAALPSTMNAVMSAAAALVPSAVDAQATHAAAMDPPTAMALSALIGVAPLVGAGPEAFVDPVAVWVVVGVTEEYA